MNGDSHIHMSAAALRRAYRQAGATPAAGTWYYQSDLDGQAYRCPLNVVFDVASTLSAEANTGSPRECIVGFLRGWDGLDPAILNECKKCYKLGAKLRAQLNPIRIGG
jgi:hypothetical protein